MRSRLHVLALMLALAGFVYGAASLFLARYERGDAYPPYSSFRADPLGTKALYQSLASMPGVRVARNVEPIGRAARNRAITVFVNGLSFNVVGHDVLGRELADGLQEVLRRGGRVVLSFAPVTDDVSDIERDDIRFQERMKERQQRRAEQDDGSAPPLVAPPPTEDAEEEPPVGERDATAAEDSADTAKDEEPTGDAEKKVSGDSRDRAPYDDWMATPVRWDEQWGVALRFGALERDVQTNAYVPAIARRTEDGPLPESVPVRTTLYFKPETPEWRTVYAHNDGPVVIERPVADGTLVLMADAYLLSNEAMRADRRPDLLAWLAGPNKAILFDETTLGTERTVGLASLMWQYRLQGVVVALIVVAVLYIWKNGQPLVPPFHDTLPANGYALAGKDSASGLTNLLKRSVPQGQVLRACLGEWEKSFSHRAGDMAESIRDAKAIIVREENLPAKQRDIAKAYRDICAAFAKHRLG